MRGTVTLIPLFVVLYFVGKATSFIESVGWGPIAFFGGLILFFSIIHVISDGKRQRRLKAARHNLLLAKYRDPDVVSRIERGDIWIGQTAEQLRDSLGPPVACESKSLKTISRETLKYSMAGKNQYLLRITLDNGAVATWTDRR